MCVDRGGLHCLDMGNGEGCRKDKGGYTMKCALRPDGQWHWYEGGPEYDYCMSKSVRVNGNADFGNPVQENLPTDEVIS